ncbi:hypothetical protein A3Q56_07189 [Intoshia linei]|uniref:Peptidase A2 domain-containing protein n=1 Tax=Intoshia linei TaxID=1819745 RepID=A0A177ASL5_9BILA|nr:hypothetical protein A3Q56_07189 [Intoshia linei]
MELITIPIQLEGRILRALIDSGSADSYISEQYTDSLTATPVPTQRTIPHATAIEEYQ